MRTYVTVRGGRVSEVAADVVREQPLTIRVNGEKFLTLLCSPMMLEALVVGYLWMEKVIGDVEEIARVEVSPVDGRADVTLTHAVTLPTERILTSGCGGGITFRIDHRLFPRLHSSLRVRPADLANGMKQLFQAATQYQRSRGIHGAALSDGTRRLGVKDKGRDKREDYALDLFREAAAYLDDHERVNRVLRELGKLYNPVKNAPIVDLETRQRIMTLLGAGAREEAARVLDERRRSYAPLDQPDDSRLRPQEQWETQ